MRTPASGRGSAPVPSPPSAAVDGGCTGALPLRGGNSAAGAPLPAASASPRAGAALRSAHQGSLRWYGAPGRVSSPKPGWARLRKKPRACRCGSWGRSAGR